MAVEKTRLSVMLRCAAFFLLFFIGSLRGDQIEMQNGDRYAGKILLVTTNTVVMQSEVLGKIALPRSRVLTVTFGANGPAGSAKTALPQTISTNNQAASLPETNADIPAALRHLGADTNFIQQIQSQMLGAAGPDANKKFNDLVGGLMSGKLDLNDIRSQAASSAAQLRDLKRSLGNEAGDSLDAYLEILDNFLKETAPEATASNKPPARPDPKAPAVPARR